jgi:TolB-like protein
MTAHRERIATRVVLTAAAVGLIVALSLWPLAAAPPPLDLTRQAPVTRGGQPGLWERTHEQVSIAGKLYSGVLWTGRGRWTGLGPNRAEGGWAVWRIPPGYRALQTYVGVDDSLAADVPVTFVVSIDGDPAKSAKVGPGEKAVLLSVPVKPGSSLRLEIQGFGGVFAEPQLLSAAAAEPGSPPVAPGGLSLPSAPFAVDPRDTDQLATSLRQKADANPVLRQRLASGRVAVSTFSLIDVPSPSVAQNVAEDLYTAMINSGFALVERGQLDKVLKELKIQNMGLVDPQTALKIGKLSGCDVILLGSISDRGQSVVINARLMEIATGQSIVADRVEMRKIPIAGGG